MIFAKKSLGQNFLIDLNIVKKILNQVSIKNKNDGDFCQFFNAYAEMPNACKKEIGFI